MGKASLGFLEAGPMARSIPYVGGEELVSPENKVKDHAKEGN